MGLKRVAETSARNAILGLTVLYFLFSKYIPYDVNKSKLYSERNYEQIEVRECSLPLGAEPFVFQFAIQKFKDQDI